MVAFFFIDLQWQMRDSLAHSTHQHAGRSHVGVISQPHKPGRDRAIGRLPTEGEILLAGEPRARLGRKIVLAPVFGACPAAY